LAKRREETGILFSGESDNAQLRDHDRPTEDGDDREKRKDELSCARRVIEREKQTAGR
jgi:hypothetical protein